MRVTVLGSINVGTILSVAELPRPGETVLANDSVRAAGGKGANQAVAAARMGIDQHDRRGAAAALCTQARGAVSAMPRRAVVEAFFNAPKDRASPVKTPSHPEINWTATRRERTQA